MDPKKAQLLNAYGRQSNPNQSLVAQPQITAQGLQYTNPDQSPVASNGFMPGPSQRPAPINLYDSGATLGGGPDGPGFSAMQKWFGGTNEAGASTMGYVPAALGIGQFGANVYFGMKNYGLAKDQLKLQKESFNFNKDLSLANLDNQSRTVNAELEDRQRARNISNPNQAQDTASYMAKYGVRGNV